MRSPIALATSALLLLAACSDAPSDGPPAAQDPSATTDAGRKPPVDAGSPSPEAGTAPDASKPSCDLSANATVINLASTDHQYAPHRLQAFNGVLYWTTFSASSPVDGDGQVSAYVLAQKKFFSIYSNFDPSSLNVNARGVYFTDFNLQHYSLAGGNGISLSTLSGYYPLLLADGGYEFSVGSATDKSDNKMYATDADGQWSGNMNALQGAFTQFVAADTTNAYFVLYSSPLSGPRRIDVARTNRALSYSSVEGLVSIENEEPTSFAIDESSFFIATKGTSGALTACHKDGTSCKELVSESMLVNLTVTPTYVYFTDSGHNRVRRVRKDGSAAAEDVFRACGFIQTMTSVGDAVYFISSTNVGKNGITIWSTGP